MIQSRILTIRDEVVANCDHLANLKFSHQLPYAFAEQGVAMLSTALKNDAAVKCAVGTYNNQEI